MSFENHESKLARITFWTIDWDVFRSVIISLEDTTDSIDEYFISIDDRPGYLRFRDGSIWYWQYQTEGRPSCRTSYWMASYSRPIKYIHIYVADGTTSTADFTGLEKYKNIFIIQGQEDYNPTRKVPPCSSPKNDVAATDEISGWELRERTFECPSSLSPILLNLFFKFW